MKMTKEELLTITGGGTLSVTAVLSGVGALITFIIGAVDGYLRPQKCE